MSQFLHQMLACSRTRLCAWLISNVLPCQSAFHYNHGLNQQQSRALSTMKIEGVLLDISGTCIIGDALIPGASEAVQRLYDRGLKVKFITNTTKENSRELHQRLVDLNMPVQKNDIFSSLTAARSLVKKENRRPLLFLEEGAKEDFDGIETTNPNCVVIGLAPSCFTYEKMNEAFRLLLDNNQAPLIAIHKARYYRTKEGLDLGPGGFVTALEYATEQKAFVVGKPSKTFFLEAIQSWGMDVENVVMVGDDVRDDVEGAMKAGMKGILVRTGKYLKDDEQRIEPQPTFVADSIVEAVNFILKDSS